MSTEQPIRIFAYGYRDYDEAPFFTTTAAQLGIDLGISREKPTLDNLDLCAGYDAITILTHPIDEPMMARLAQLGIKMVNTRTIGYEHVDLEAARKYGIHVSNGSYPPNSVADYAIMLMLMATRRMKHIMQRGDLHDFTLKGNMGRDFSKFTVGIVGTGRIGRTVIEHLQGFGVKILAYDPFPNPALEEAGLATYVPLEQIWADADLISFHTPMLESTYHMVNPDTLAAMKDGVVLVNTARGGLIDSEALIDALASGKVSAAALDVVENEFNMYYYDLKDQPFLHRQLAALKSFPNVIVTPHMAFYTDDDIRGMVESGLQSIVAELTGQDNPWRIL